MTKTQRDKTFRLSESGPYHSHHISQESGRCLSHVGLSILLRPWVRSPRCRSPPHTQHLAEALGAGPPLQVTSPHTQHLAEAMGAVPLLQVTSPHTSKSLSAAQGWAGALRTLPGTVLSFVSRSCLAEGLFPHPFITGASADRGSWLYALLLFGS